MGTWGPGISAHHYAVTRELTGAQYTGPVQHLWDVDCPTRGKYALKHYGEVVAMGVLRSDAADPARDQSRGFADGPAISGGDWGTVAAFLTGEWHDGMVEITRHVYGL